jgi:Glyoxalase-like domain
MGRTWVLPLVFLASTAMAQTLTIDHVTICGSDLDAMRQAFAAAGLRTDYGGPHASGGTHMALLSFDDGSYVELIAPEDPNEPLPDRAPWPKEIEGNAGPCGWAINVRQIEREVELFRGRGLEATTPAPGGRLRPDRVALEWQTAALAGGSDHRLPFLIQDQTPRHLRAPKSAGVAGTELTGVAVVVLAVHDLAGSTALFQRAFGWSDPLVETNHQLDAEVAYFPGTPVMLAAPLSADSWLADRLQRFGEIPAAFLLGTRDFNRSRKRFSLTGTGQLNGRKLAWFDPAQLHAVRLGLVELATDH